MPGWVEYLDRYAVYVSKALDPFGSRAFLRQGAAWDDAFERIAAAGVCGMVRSRPCGPCCLRAVLPNRQKTPNEAPMRRLWVALFAAVLLLIGSVGTAGAQMHGGRGGGFSEGFHGGFH